MHRYTFILTDIHTSHACMYMLTYIQCIHAHMRAYAHTYIYVCLKFSHMQLFAYIHTYIPICIIIHSYIHACKDVPYVPWLRIFYNQSINRLLNTPGWQKRSPICECLL